MLGRTLDRLAIVVLLVVFMWSFASALRFRTATIEAEGQVVALEHSRRASHARSRHRSLGMAPVVEFRTWSGDPVRVTSSVYTEPPIYTVGEVVRVRYPPGRPEEAEIDGPLQAWLMPGVSFALFAVFGTRAFLAPR